ncbi:MAG TPA: hypothetical protein VJ875_08910, partial [Pyrinomonadaceae bacterium]|nr:hypothetical protein [Pyrinomonadaceae bacterium]
MRNVNKRFQPYQYELRIVGGQYETGSEAVSVTPRAFTNFSPGVGAQRQPWDGDLEVSQTLKAFGNWRTLSEFHRSDQATQGSRSRSNHGLKLANAFGVT